MDHFLDMGGYAYFVWPAYGVVALLLLVFAVQAWHELRRQQAELTALERLGLGRRRDRQADRQDGSGGHDESEA